MATKAVKARVEEYATVFRPYYGKKMQVQITNSKVKPFNSYLRNVRVGTLELIKPLDPSKRDGKTPPFFMVEFDDGKLFFIMDDIQSHSINLSGITLDMGEYSVRIVEIV